MTVFWYLQRRNALKLVIRLGVNSVKTRAAHATGRVDASRGEDRQGSSYRNFWMLSCFFALRGVVVPPLLLFSTAFLHA